MPLGFGSGSPSTLGYSMAAVRAGGLILEANREYAKGRFTEALPLYEEALCMELDSRTRFVVLRNQGRIFLTLANIDELSRAQRRADARRAWTEAIGIREGGVDRAAVALDCGLLCLEDGLLPRRRGASRPASSTTRRTRTSPRPRTSASARRRGSWARRRARRPRG